MRQEQWPRMAKDLSYSRYKSSIGTGTNLNKERCNLPDWPKISLISDSQVFSQLTQFYETNFVEAHLRRESSKRIALREESATKTWTRKWQISVHLWFFFSYNGTRVVTSVMGTARYLDPEHPERTQGSNEETGSNEEMCVTISPCHRSPRVISRCSDSTNAGSMTAPC